MRRSIVIAIAIAAIAAAWILSGQFGGSESPPSAAPAERAAASEAPPQVRVRASNAQAFRARIVVTGRTQAARRVEIKAEVDGPIEKILAAEGSRLRDGEPIAKIALKDRSARLAEARAWVAQRRAEYEAAEKLAAKGYRSQVQLATDRAELDQVLARLKQVELEIGDTTIRAPFAGILETRAVEVGDFVKRGDKVAEVVDLDPIVIAVQVSETDVGALEIGQAGHARLVTGREVDGRIRYIAATADQATRTFRVELEVPNPKADIREGLTAELVLPGRTLQAHLLSPALLTLADDGRIGVKLVEDGAARFVPVRILADGPEGVWLGGLPESASVIAVGQEYVADGQRVEAVPAAAAETRS